MKRMWLIGFLMLSVSTAALADAGQVDVPSRGLVLWLRADQGVESNGPHLIRWLDQSGNGFHAAPDEGSEPLIVPNVVNGHPVVRFNGNNTYLRIPHHDSLNADASFSVFIVFYYEGGFRLAQKKDAAAGLEDDVWMIAPRNGLGVSGRWTSDLHFPSKEDHLQTSIFDSSEGTIRIFRDGELVATVTDVPAQKPNDDDVYIGKRNRPGSSEGHLNGDIAEMLIYKVALTADEQARVEAYLLQKYGLDG